MEPRAACACPVSAMRRRPWLLAMCAYPQDILLTPQRCLPHNFHLNSGRCSKSFRLLTADQCAACLRGGLASGDLGTQCDACGRLYPFLQESPCGICRQYDNDLGAAVDQAFHNAPNPRAHKAALPQVRTREASEMDIIEAEQVHQTMRNSYHHAVGSSAGGPLQGPKVPSVPFGAKASRSATSKVVMLFLKVTKFQVRWAAGGVKGPNFTLIPYGKMYPLSSPFSEIEENIRTEVDSQLAGLHVLNRRLMSDDDITLMYELPKTKIDPSLTRGTLGDLWYNTIRADNIDHVISKSHVASRTLNLHAHIILCGEKVDTETGTTLANHSQKRKATLSMSTPNGTQLVPAAKARALDTVSRHRYDTTLNVATAYTVVRTTCSMESDGSTTLIQADEPFEVMVNDNKSASGTTKNMFRLAYNESVYAAKCFYNIGLGSQPPTASENAEALQKELIVLTVAQSLCDTFIDRAKALKIGIADIRVSQSALFTVTSGERKGHAWLVDPMLPTTTISKFSGTNHAGANSKLLGYTCDALAHFSLMESDATLVLVDIQGIRVPKTVQGVSGTDDLVLLDLMTHTRTGMSGIGDRGFPGIKDFAQQHACNTLCSNLRLTSCEDILDAAIEADEGLRHLRHNSPGLGPGESASEIASQLLRAHPSNSDDSSTNDDADLKSEA
ncbi:hypothetical protein PLICRDRAFT_53262 [Plicaturopsis crispa FD-325 SS-3]|nr:hypothetical protein PLICRDRAFT_53262 [Plicaturopsis crispa FD-325 SS-3]